MFELYWRAFRQKFFIPNLNGVLSDLVSSIAHMRNFYR